MPTRSANSVHPIPLNWCTGVRINSCAITLSQGGDRELIYCDPPYLHNTRRSNRRYRYDYTEQDHIDLLNLLNTLPCQIILSGYPSTLYDDTLDGWSRREIQVMNHNGVRTEKLWFNFTPDKVHWASFAGKNFTDRQRIKRKAENWAKRYQAMPPNERLAVLAAVMAVEDNEAIARA